jgi:hypothetical protein
MFAKYLEFWLKKTPSKDFCNGLYERSVSPGDIEVDVALGEEPSNGVYAPDPVVRQHGNINRFN